MKLTKLLTVAALALTPIAAQAEILTARDANSLHRFFEDEGADVERLIDNVGDPQLDVVHYGDEFTVFYYGCSNNDNCDAIQFYSGYATDGRVRLKTVNDFNEAKRWVRAYVADDGSTKLEMDVYFGDGGLDADDFNDLVSFWTRRMNEFEDIIGYSN